MSGGLIESLTKGYIAKRLKDNKNLSDHLFQIYRSLYLHLPFQVTKVTET